MKKLFIIILLFCLPLTAGAQKFAIGTNVVQYACLGTLNLEGGMTLSQHFSLTAGARFNPWKFEKHNPDYITQLKQKTAYIGMRYWPWYVFSGLWIGAKAQYCNFNMSGIWRPALETGRALGAGLSAGYSFMLGEHFNLDLGLGAWGGYAFEYCLYHCPYCGDVRDNGPRGFAFLDDISISFVYLF